MTPRGAAVHTDIAIVERPDGPPSLIRPGQLITDRRGARAAERWIRAASSAGGVRTVWLNPGLDPLRIAADLRARGHLASANHVFVGQPLWFGGPASRPVPADPVTWSPEPAGPRAVTVAVLDTGIAGHPWWRPSPWFAEVGHADGETPDSDGDGRLDTQAGHGTFIAGLLVRGAPGVRLRVSRVLDGHGVGDEAGVLRALDRLRHDPPEVLNLSFGGYTPDDAPPPLLAAALARLSTRGGGGTAVVACAGNTPSARPFWPAALPEVIAVGALDTAGQSAAPFSAHGPWVDACAPGEWLTSSFLHTAGFRGYARWSGTSFASALVSAAIAGTLGSDLASTPGEAAVGFLAPPGGHPVPGLGAAVPSGL
ncbi:S8/S53 family peptidase [Spongiactinospora sp. TRM90649]|uniref:S8 family peptidase n=1 Tax=Spongiactinospora sp. TRM90649 TaxID=3031114 RepID=UPI0023F9836C|nr:S8/S53 family peptidase [Spongiactinospora sp. TRM90649]MDF5755407.1 S8/S53 family peptidase [Spongiactinospora sp. TRM90649]